MHKTKIDISSEKRQKIIELLNARLADASDLKSQAKQAHWNVKGMNFIALHELFDQTATEVEAHIDLIAERIRYAVTNKPRGNAYDDAMREGGQADYSAYAGLETATPSIRSIGG